uniref:Uncharacterized protein n=1 Tax=Anopheles merus TaxID=30066 RepID=A0A2Y9D2Z8_ANOME
MFIIFKELILHHTRPASWYGVSSFEWAKMYLGYHFSFRQHLMYTPIIFKRCSRCWLVISVR